MRTPVGPWIAAAALALTLGLAARAAWAGGPHEPVLRRLIADAAQGRIDWRRRAYAHGDCAGAWLVIACASRPEVNAAVARIPNRDDLLSFYYRSGYRLPEGASIDASLSQVLESGRPGRELLQ